MLLIYLIKISKKKRVFIEKRGITLSTPDYKIFFPSLYLKNPFISLEGEQLRIHLSKAIEGISYLILKYRFTTDGKKASPSIFIGTEHVTCGGFSKINPSWLQKAKKLFTAYSQGSFENENALDLTHTNRAKNILSLKRDTKVLFPSFCPITDSEIETFAILEGFKIPLSKKGAFLLKHQHKFRRVWLLFMSALFVSTAIFLPAQNFYFLSIGFALLFWLGWNYSYLPFFLLKTNKECVMFYVGRSDYFEALVRLTFRQ